MALVKQFDDFINEAHTGDPKKYKQWWDKGPETQIRRKFGDDYDNAINNRVNLLLTLVDDPDTAEKYAEMDFLKLPNGISTQLVNMDPKELHAILDESVNEAAFPEWEVTFKKMNLSGVKLDPKNVYKVKASGTAMAIKKAAKAAGVSDSDWVATETDSIKKL